MENALQGVKNGIIETNQEATVAGNRKVVAWTRVVPVKSEKQMEQGPILEAELKGLVDELDVGSEGNRETHCSEQTVV